ncbi:MAG TPA: ectoine hydrolase DoeA, partial [Sediminispirochaeta sp.]|nr:ectoine hydrolase DoeA [Sediminispirochaeta sp.]
GVEKPSRVGYSYGLNYVPDWGEHTVSLRPGDKTVLEPGMTIHFMPGIWLDTYGFECSEPFLVTEDGCEKFIEYPQKLFSK